MKQYLDEINSFASYLKTVSKWQKSFDPFGHLANSEDDYVYEFWCYTRILKALSENPTQFVRLKNGTKSFPKSPALKSEGWSYFEIYDQNNELLFQVCAGTGVKRSDAPTSVHNPDITFQISAATDDPTENDVELIMDAKFQYEFTKKGKPRKLATIPVKEIHAFSHRVNVLATKDAHTIALDFGSLAQLKGNSILSNGEVNRNHETACEVDCVKQVGKFIPGSIPEVIGKK